MKPIYVPKGKAKEYGDYAVNIYTGCPHRCFYCFAPSVLRRNREVFHTCIQPREGIVEAVKQQLEKENITGKLIHLCFTCDPYPTGCDTFATRDIIRAIKAADNHVQILTKGDGSRDFDLLDENDWYGVTVSCGPEVQAEAEPGATMVYDRLLCLQRAKMLGIKTWISFEPVLNCTDFVEIVSCVARLGWADKVKIGKLNYWPSDIDWKKFGREAETLCQKLGLDYYIKDGLRKEMEGN